MGLYEQIRDIAKTKGYSVNKLEQELGFARSSINKFNKNKPSIDKLQQIADFLGVSVDYLTTNEDTLQREQSLFTARDERDIKKSLDKFMESLETKDGAPLYYDGNELELTDENKAMLRDALNTALHTVKLINKEKYNPHKNGK